MKKLLLIPLLLVFQLTFSQNHSLKELLTQKPLKIRDTIFRLQAADSSRTEIPATLISGKLKGPTLTVAAGIHGTSYAAIAAVMKLRKEINPEKLKGNLILIPVLNMDSFYSRSDDTHPIDKKDLNRCFPGNAAGTITEVIADFITTKIFDATDVFLEVHSSGENRTALPFIGYYDNKEYIGQTRLSSNLCESSGFSAIIKYQYGQQSGQPAIYPFKQAVRLGIPSFSMHLGNSARGKKTFHTSARTALYNIMGELGMYELKKRTATITKKDRYSHQSYVLSPAKGFFRSSCKPGQKVLQEEEIGYITDSFGRNVNIITAPHGGTILSKIDAPPVRKGETLFFIGY